MQRSGTPMPNKYLSLLRGNLENGLIDLHIHTCFSDGLLSPEDIVSICNSQNLNYFSITDHNTVAGIKAYRAMLDLPAFIPGIEISTDFNGTEFHILGYHINIDSPSLSHVLNTVNKVRLKSNLQLVSALQRLGITLQVKTNDLLSRKRIALAVQKIMPQLSMNTIIAELLNYQRYNIPKPQKPAFDEIVDVIHDSKGIAVLAHPMLYERKAMLSCLETKRLDGIECFHPKQSNDDRYFLCNLAKKYDLLITGGSDFHSPNDSCRIGQFAQDRPLYVSCFIESGDAS